MAKIYANASELIGGTPLVAFDKLAAKYEAPAKILAKLEYFNPAGSVKDRVAREIIEDAEKSGKLKTGATIIEPTPPPTLRNLKRNLIINTPLHTVAQLIMRIIPFENDGFVLILLDFSCLDKLLLFSSDAFKKNGSRFIVWALGYKLALYSLLEN